MTSVKYVYEAAVRDGASWVELPVTAIRPSVDLDRVPYAAATLTIGPVPASTWVLLDPRTIDPSTRGNVRWRIRQEDEAGTVLGYLPRVGAPTAQWALMHVRRVSRTLDSTSIEVHGGERLVEDRLVIEETRYLGRGWEISTELAKPTTLGAYVDQVLTLTFGNTHAIPADETAIAVAALGSPTRLYPGAAPSGPYNAGPAAYGSTFLQLVEVELNSVGCRLIDAWGLGWYIIDRERGPAFPGAPETIKWASYEGAPGGVPARITGLSEDISRDNNWADTVVVTGTTEREKGALVWKHTAAGGVGSRGIVIEMKAAQPSGNLAASIASRAYRRGHDITVTTQIDFAVTPGATLELHLRTTTITAQLVSVDWDLDAGTMTVHARSAQTMPLSGEDRYAREEVSGTQAVAVAQRAATDAYSSAVAQIPGITVTERMRAAYENAQLAGTL